MPTRFRPYQPKQMLLLSPDLREWVPEGHLAPQVSELVDGLGLGAFYRPYEEDGRRDAPYEPRMMVKVLIYAYATGVFSSRKIARKLEEDVAFRMLAAGNFPQHRTICEFRRRHLKDFKKLFVQVVSLGREMGMVRLGRLGIDGDESAGEREPAQGDELWTDEEAGAATEGRDRTVVGEGAAAGRGGRRALRGRPARGRVAAGVTSAGGSAGSDKRRPSSGWRRRSVRPTMSGAGSRGRSGTRKGGVATSGPTGNRRRSLRATSPTPRARS